MKLTNLTRPQLIALLVQHNVTTVSKAKVMGTAQLRGALTDECLDRLREVYGK